VSAAIMVYLFLSEFSTYSEVKRSTEMLIDVNRGGELVIIYYLFTAKNKY